MTSVIANGLTTLTDPVGFLATHWPGQGHRNQAYAALCGGLLRSGLPLHQVQRLVSALGEATGDEETAERVKLVERTATRIHEDEPATGWKTLAELLGANGTSIVAEFKRRLGLVVSLVDLARHKCLPLEFLEEEGIHNLPFGGIGIPYHDAGDKITVKERFALRAGDGSRWPKGRRLIAYGEHHLVMAASAGYQVLVEGETDALTLWYHGEPALGLPGAETVAKTLHQGHIAQRALVYVVEERDEAGKDFVRNVAARLAELAWDGTLKVVRLPTKDVSDLHCQDSNAFKAVWREALDKATPLPLSSAGHATGGGDPWPAPVPLSQVPDVPRFPVEVLPEPLRRCAEEIAWAMNCPVDYVGVAMLALGGGGLANSRHLRITRSHAQPPSLYAVYAGPPGSAKSPPLKLLRRPFDEVQACYLQEWRAAKQAWEAQEKEERGPRPILRRCVVSDTTTESLGITLVENPRGLLMIRNELSGLIAGMNQYKGGKGHDR
jgi:hypothetical protein